MVWVESEPPILKRRATSQEQQILLHSLIEATEAEVAAVTHELVRRRSSLLEEPPPTNDLPKLRKRRSTEEQHAVVQAALDATTAELDAAKLELSRRLSLRWLVEEDVPIAPSRLSSAIPFMSDLDDEADAAWAGEVSSIRAREAVKRPAEQTDLDASAPLLHEQPARAVRQRWRLAMRRALSRQPRRRWQRAALMLRTRSALDRNLRSTRIELAHRAAAEPPAGVVLKVSRVASLAAVPYWAQGDPDLYAKEVHRERRDNPRLCPCRASEAHSDLHSHPPSSSFRATPHPPTPYRSSRAAWHCVTIRPWCLHSKTGGPPHSTAYAPAILTLLPSAG